jgi:hypothetical protein
MPASKSAVRRCRLLKLHQLDETTKGWRELVSRCIDCRFCEAELGLKDDELVEWTAKHGDEKIRLEFGESAVGRGLRPTGELPAMICPKCGNSRAQFVEAGF